MSKFRFFAGLSSLLVFTLATSACGIKKTASSVTAQVMKDAIPSVEEEDDIAYANQASITTLKTLEGLQRVNPNDPTILFMLARSFGSYTFAFVENDILEAKGVNEAYEKLATDRAKRFYGRGKKYGLMLLSKNHAFKKAMDGSLDDFKKALNSFTKKDVPALFWTAFNWGSLINFSKDSPEAIAELPRIEAMMKRVEALDDKYYYGGPHLFFGAFYAARPKMLGGQPEEAKKEFDEAIDITQGKFLMSKVMKAQYYAVQTQDKPLFVSILKEVVDADPSALPSQRLGNELAKRRAEVLLKKEKLFF
ncbi:MAG: TRAP transporter TatT component family protein [bacterium]